MYNSRRERGNIIGPRGARAREAQNMSPEELCDKLRSLGLGISSAYEVALLEGQERCVWDFELPILAEALDVSVDWLMEGKQEEGAIKEIEWPIRVIQLKSSEE